MSNPDCWTETKDVHGSGGDGHKVASVSECQTTCIGILTCVAIDWEPEPPYDPYTCWILSTTAFGPTDTPGAITHYELNQHCPATTTTS